jgi:hypothetical protein
MPAAGGTTGRQEGYSAEVWQRCGWHREEKQACAASKGSRLGRCWGIHWHCSGRMASTLAVISRAWQQCGVQGVPVRACTSCCKQAPFLLWQLTSWLCPHPPMLLAAYQAEEAFLKQQGREATKIRAGQELSLRTSVFIEKVGPGRQAGRAGLGCGARIHTGQRCTQLSCAVAQGGLT